MGNRTRLSINIRRSDNGCFIVSYSNFEEDWDNNMHEFVFSTIDGVNKFLIESYGDVSTEEQAVGA